MLVTAVFFVISLLFGLFLWRRLHLSTGLAVIDILISLTLGTVSLTLILFFVGFMGFFSRTAIWLVIMSVGVITGGWLIREIGGVGEILGIESKSLKGLKVKDIVLGALLICLVVWLFGRALFFDQGGNLVAGDRLVWTDWPLHIAMASSFAWGDNFPPQNPIFAGISLIYPFMADFLSGVLLKLGVSYPLAFGLPGIVLTLTFFGMFVVVGVSLLRESKYLKSLKGLKLTNVVLVALFICLFWGGLGWVYWFEEAFKSEVTLVETLMAPPREYTFWDEKNLWFFTFLYSEILPQRAFLFGLPLFLVILYLVKCGWEKKKFRYLGLAGVLTGIMPFFHTHTFLSLVIFSAAAAVVGGIVLLISKIGQISKIRKEISKNYYKALFLYFTPVLILGIFQLPFFLSQTSGFPFHFGWLKGEDNFFWFWFKNTGVFWPLYIIGIWKGKFSGFVRLLGFANISLFIIPNNFQFAPWAYDNLKIFTYWYLIGSVFVVTGLIWIYGKWDRLGKVVAGVLFFTLILSGVVEVARLLPTDEIQIRLWTPEQQSLAQTIKDQTPADAVFLTAAVHDHPVSALAGRKIVIGFPGNAWSWGIDGWSEREQDVRAMFRGGPEAKELWKKYEIDFIIVGDKERWFDPELDEEYIAGNSQLVIEQEGNRVYKVK